MAAWAGTADGGRSIREIDSFRGVWPGVRIAVTSLVRAREAKNGMIYAHVDQG